MSDIFEKTQGLGNKKRDRVCRVTYTLNNTQPVTCTIIGDQPLFYMDIEEDLSGAEMMFDAADISVLDHEIETLRKEIETFDRLSEEFLQPASQRLDDFRADKEFVTGQKEDEEEEYASKADLIELVSSSRLAQAYLDFMKQYGVEITLSHQVEDACYDRRAGLIYINPRLDMADQALLLARELRRHWQHRQGVLIHPMMFQPDNAVLVNRLLNADLAVSMVRAAWELQLSGFKKAWERIENSSLADLGRALAREAFLDFRTLNNGQASAAVFESWFLSERCRYEDKKLIKQMLADYQGYVFNTEIERQAITPALISALGNMPYGKNYLAAHAATILSDPIFIDVRDRSNANFLWFIKFERSFRETEQELQPGLDHAAGGVRLTALHEKDRVENNESAKAADIITLFPDQGKDEETGDKKGKRGKILPPKSTSKRKKKGQEDASNIVYLRQWSGE